MIVAAHQPYFAPFGGFFHKIHLADTFVILDTVQYPRGTTWMSRNRFKNAQGTLWLTIPTMKKGLGLQRIDEVRICDDGRWARKHLDSIRTAYAHAPYLADHAVFIEELFSGKHERLLDLNMDIVLYLLEIFPIRTEVTLLSDLGIKTKGTRLIIDICRALGSSRYLVQSSAMKYVDPKAFQDAGIQLHCFRYPSPIYPQLWGEFLPNLSAWDLVLNCGPKAWELLTNK